ncbi:MAG: malic enzyme protein 2 [Linnemannia elongata]|nr:MAG: malic enzyme protein 2 [Linnemannia elongata]
MASTSSSLSRSWVTRSSTVLRSTSTTTSKKFNCSPSSTSASISSASFSTRTNRISSPRLHLSSTSSSSRLGSSSISSSSISTPRSPFSFSSFSTLSSTSNSSSSLPSSLPSSLSKRTIIRALSSASPASLTDDIHHQHQQQKPTHTNTMTVSETNNIHIQQISKSSYLNQSTATPAELRNALRLHGLSPAKVESFDTQKKRALAQLRSKTSDIEKYVFLAWLRNTNVRLFYGLVSDQLEETLPLIYTPTVGTACQNYSSIYPFLAPPGQPDGLFLSINDLPNLTQIIQNYRPYPQNPELTPQIAVITDGSRILGLGDLGVGGMGIPVGKLQLYVAGAGVDPRRTIPITLDLGTNNEDKLKDEFYLGLRQKRVGDDQFFPFVDAVIQSLTSLYPKLLIQFEDFSSEHAFQLLEKYQPTNFCFNDDIQGTGAVILAGFMNAINLAGIPAKDHKILFFGAGSAAVGVAKQLAAYFVNDHGMSEDEAREMVWLVDSKGLVTLDRGDRLAEHKLYFARKDNSGSQYPDIASVIEHVRPTALFGLSSQAGAFSEQVLKSMAGLNERPIVFPLSNPAYQAECSFEQAMTHTKGKVIFASGTAFPKYTDPNTGLISAPGQGNNMYIFPGLGLGGILAQPDTISDRLIYSAARACANALTVEERSQGLLYPVLPRIRQVSAEVAAAVVAESVAEGTARNEEAIKLVNAHDRSALLKFVTSNMWTTNEVEEEITTFAPHL